MLFLRKPTENVRSHSEKVIRFDGPAEPTKKRNATCIPVNFKAGNVGVGGGASGCVRLKWGPTPLGEFCELRPFKMDMTLQGAIVEVETGANEPNLSEFESYEDRKWGNC